MTPTALVQTMEKMIGEIEQQSAVSADLLNRVKKIVEQFPQEPSYHEKLQAWKLSFRIWNTCVDLVNNCNKEDDQEEEEEERGDYAVDHEGHAARRQAASDLLSAAGTIDGVESCPMKIATFYYKTGTIWHKASNFGQASVCFDKATEIISKGGNPVDKEEQQLFFDLLLARSQTAWELNHRAVVWSLLARARNLLVHFREKIPRLAEHYLQHGKELLAKEDDKESQSEAIKYLEHAFEICCESKGPAEEPGNCKSSNSLSALKLQILRYLAVGHSQKENHLSVLKCLAVLKLGPSHPSTHYLGVKALVGLDRYEEAEVELFSLIRQNTASVEACLSALELVLQDSSRMDGCKRAFFALQSFHASNKVIPLRMLEYLLKKTPAVSDGSCSSQVKRVEVALEIAVSSNIVSVITDKSPAAAHCLPLLNVADGSGNKEQICMHALLWNSGTEHFSGKLYATSIKLFEASMLYLPGDGESHSIAQRAKALRVLCLCHLALCQYDRAAEFADEAHKIEPNIASRFLKFKILLQTNKEVEAVDVVKDMLNCTDFEPDFLTLASHEAMTQNAAQVAAAALSTLLSLQLEKKNTGTKEIILFRNLIHISLRSPDIQKEALYYMKQAQSHLAEAGFEPCFGSGGVAQQECKWFASTAWNQGLQTIKCQDWRLSFEWLASASDFIASLEETQDNLMWLQKCLLLAASSSLLVADTGVDSLRQTTKMLEKCTKINRALAMSMESANAEEHTQLEAQLALLSFEVKGRAKDHKAQLDILYQCGALPQFKADYYLMMANSVRKEAAAEPSCLDVATTAIRLALKFMLSSSSPDYNLVALTLRTQIKLLDQQKKDGPEVLAVYRQAKEIVASLSAGEYPADEAQWLVATSWNRAGLHLKFQRYGEAEAWMELALDLVKYAPELDQRKAAMLDGLNYVRQKQIRKKSVPSNGV